MQTSVIPDHSQLQTVNDVVYCKGKKCKTKYRATVQVGRRNNTQCPVCLHVQTYSFKNKLN